MSISGVSENSSSNTNSLSDSSYFENNNPVDNSSSDNTPTQKDINNTQTSLEQMASQPTIGEKIASELTTAEQLSGQTFGITATKPEQTNIHLAGGLFPDIVQQELQQQLQPLSNALENAMAPPNPETMTPMGVVSYWATGSASNGDLSFSPNSVMSQTFSQGNGAAAFEDFVYQKFDGNPKAGDTVVNFDYTFTAGRFAYTSNMAEHVVGSWQNGTAVVTNDSISFTVENVMGIDSLLAGRPLQDHFGIEGIGELDSDLKMTISWEVPLRNQ